MAIDTTASNVATNALKALPFGSMIGGPLKACIEAQAMAAQSTWQFIQEVGLTVNPETGEKSAVNVSFSFMQGGHMVQLNVPLLTIVPIPYIAIHSIDINFKANISAASSTASEQSSSTEAGGSAKVKGGYKSRRFHVEAEMNANYSSKKDSKATAESKYSVEYTMDVAVKAGQDSMPAGLAKVLELLGNALDVSDPGGMLDVNATQLTAEDELVITYKNKDGLYAPKEIQIYSGTGIVELPETAFTSDNVIHTLGEGTYTVKAGEKSVVVKVTAKA